LNPPILLTYAGEVVEEYVTLNILGVKPVICASHISSEYFCEDIVYADVIYTMSADYVVGGEKILAILKDSWVVAEICWVVELE
jgi:hypothetical protein